MPLILAREYQTFKPIQNGRILKQIIMSAHTRKLDLIHDVRCTFF